MRPLLRLSKREREVLRLIAEGHSIRRSAKVLRLSPKTVETYRDRIKRKLAVQTGEELHRLALLARVTEQTVCSEELAKERVRSASK